MTELDGLPLRDDLRGRTPYGAPQLDVPVRLNTNENPHPPSPGLVADLVAAVQAVGGDLHRYPDREATALRTGLAMYLSARSGVAVDPAQVWAANGSNEILQQLCQAFGGPGRRALGFEPSYSMHRIIAEGTSTTYVAGSRREDFTLTPEIVTSAIREADPSIVFLCSPNNPTGTAIELSVVTAALQASTGVVVVDEAYAEFARAGTPSAVTLLAGNPRLVVTRTMSKAFAMAGTRVGYLAASPAVVDSLRLVRLPYHLSALTQTAALVALAHADELLATVATVCEERDRIAQGLADLGLAVVPSDANFLLFGTFADQAKTWQELLDRGVLVRDVGLPGWLRVTAGLHEEGEAFLAAMKECV